MQNLISSSGASNVASASLSVLEFVDDEMCVPVKKGGRVIIICL
ncbi:MAG: hypothetical protein P8Y12_04385 [Gammaproteobacteria bacterium]